MHCSRRAASLQQCAVWASTSGSHNASQPTTHPAHTLQWEEGTNSVGVKDCRHKLHRSPVHADHMHKARTLSGGDRQA